MVLCRSTLTTFRDMPSINQNLRAWDNDWGHDGSRWSLAWGSDASMWRHTVHARIGRLYYAASDPKGGAVEHGARVFDQPQCLHRPEVYAGIGEQRAADMLQGFFRQRR